MAPSSVPSDFDRILDRVRRVRRVALVGAGGKTSLMYALADRLAAEGRRVVAATTTHIFAPADRPVAGSLEELARLAGSPVVYGKPSPGGKLSLPADFDADALDSLADHVILEADGSRRMPCKAPAAHEPALICRADLVLGVAGLSGLGRPLKEVCFRLREATELLGADQSHVLTERDLARILSSPRGTRKNVDGPYAVVLNQCDVENGWEMAARIKSLLPSETVYAVSLNERNQYVN